MVKVTSRPTLPHLDKSRLPKIPKAPLPRRKATDDYSGQKAKAGAEGLALADNSIEWIDEKGTPPEGLPYGFPSRVHFEACIHELGQALRAIGADDVEALAIQNGAVTGRSKRGTPFRWRSQGKTPPSDIDLFVSSKALTEGRETSPRVPGMVHPKDVHAEHAPLRAWADRWSQLIDREISIAAFAPGHIPDGPKLDLLEPMSKIGDTEELNQKLEAAILARPTRDKLTDFASRAEPAPIS